MFNFTDLSLSNTFLTGILICLKCVIHLTDAASIKEYLQNFLLKIIYETSGTLTA